jgi:hypothetical protein
MADAAAQWLLFETAREQLAHDLRSRLPLGAGTRGQGIVLRLIEADCQRLIHKQIVTHT